MVFVLKIILEFLPFPAMHLSSVLNEEEIPLAYSNENLIAHQEQADTLFSLLSNRFIFPLHFDFVPLKYFTQWPSWFLKV